MADVRNLWQNDNCPANLARAVRSRRELAGLRPSRALQSSYSGAFPHIIDLPPKDLAAAETAALRPSAGFSLIELLVVVALMLVMMTMYYGFGSSSHQARQKKSCAENLQKMYIAMEIFATDHSGHYPDIPGAKTSEEALDGLVPRYTADTSIFICPGSKDSDLPSGESFRHRKISYAYYMGRRSGDKDQALMSDQQVDTLSKAAGQVVFSTTGKPPGNNHHKYGGNFLFCDGRVESSDAHSPFPLLLTQGVSLLNP